MAKVKKLQTDGSFCTNVATFDDQNLPDYLLSDGWIDAPAGVSPGWIDNGDGTFSEPQIIPPTQAEIDALKLLVAQAVIDIKGPIRSLALAMLSEINILRADAGLAPRTVQQLKDAVFDNSD